ncbi:decapping and exoribonuclease protein [Microplitis demolitor]|uniref:decapping and exoribonuclease protein n=1 Tax=Microplitis demolitor TaxID=69319 RepID=UPI0004CCA6FD|nr:decapping and exoribonuclease protein [Microplitis demolitor]
MVFRINKPWDKDFPYFERPKAIGYYSIDSTRSICFDSSQLTYYYPPKNNEVSFDLNHGIECVRRKTSTTKHDKIDTFLKWIMNNFDKIRAHPDSNRWLQPHIVCFRGLLSRIMKTPYDEREGWIICAAKWKGTIYLMAFDTEADTFELNNRTEKDLQFSSWGFKFEQYILSDEPNKPPDTSKPVDEKEEFCCVFQSRLRERKLLYAAEMDGVYSDKLLTDPLPIENLKFIELKTSRIVDNERQFSNLKKFKFIRWWSQSFLVGIENILCGFRDDKGIVRNLKNYRVADLPRISERFWSASTTMNFCDDFLKYVEKTVINDCNKTIYKFERIPHSHIIVTEVSPTSEYAFLPEWFIKSFNK